MQTQMVIGRILVFVLAVAIAAYASFGHTPELNEVENAWIYRLSFTMMMLRGLAYIAFDAFELFPID